jgi:hypothetical protein
MEDWTASGKDLSIDRTPTARLDEQKFKNSSQTAEL